MAFVKIDRQMFEHYLWREKPYDKARAWIDLIQLANHKDEKFMSNGVLVDGKRGCVYKSQKWLAERWGWSKGRVSRFLSMLETDGMITMKIVRNGSVNGTVLTLVNYGKFQDGRTSDGPLNEPRTDFERTSDGHIQESIKESNKESNKKYKKNKPPTASPEEDISNMTEEELQAWYAELRKEYPEYV